MRGVYLSAIDGLPGLHGHADLLAVLGFEADARRLARLGVRDRDLADVQRRFLAFEAALRVLLVRLLVAGAGIDARDDDLAVLRQALRHFAGLPLSTAAQNDKPVALLDLCPTNSPSTSRARRLDLKNSTKRRASKEER